MKTIPAVLALVATTILSAIAMAEFIPGRYEFGPVIGIDIGDTNSRVAIYNITTGEVEIIRTSRGERSIPSYIGFTTDGAPLVGMSALYQKFSNPTNTAHGLFRYLGQPFDSEPIQSLIRSQPPIIATGDSAAVGSEGMVIVKNITDGMPLIQMQIGNEPVEFSFDTLIGLLVAELRAMVERHFNTNEGMKFVVVTVPQRENVEMLSAITKIFQSQGFQVWRTTSDAVGAARALIPDPGVKSGTEELVVIDVSGVSTRITAIEWDDGVYETLASVEYPGLGGDAMDQRLAEYFAQKFKNEEKLPEVVLKTSTWNRLLWEAQRAKHALSFDHVFAVSVMDMYDGHYFSTVLERKEFDKVNQPIWDEIFMHVEELITRKNLTIAMDGKSVIMAGGSAYVTKLQEMLESKYKVLPFEDRYRPEELVVSGAAILGHLGSWQEGHESMNINVLPLSVGVATMGGIMTPILKQYSITMRTVVVRFLTARASQDSVVLEFFEGENVFVKDNIPIGKLTLDHLAQPELAGEKRLIELNLTISGYGELDITATDLGSGQSEHTFILKMFCQTYNESQVITDHMDNFWATEQKQKRVLKRWQQKLGLDADAKIKIVNDAQHAEKDRIALDEFLAVYRDHDEL